MTEKQPSPAEKVGVVLGLIIVSWAVVALLVVGTVKLAGWLW